MAVMDPAPTPALATIAMRDLTTGVITEFTLDLERRRLYGPADVFLGTTEVDFDAFVASFKTARNLARREALLSMPTRERMIGIRTISTIEALDAYAKEAWKAGDRNGEVRKRSQKAYALRSRVEEAAKHAIAKQAERHPWTIGYVDTRGVERALPGTLDWHAVSMRRPGATQSLDTRLAALRGESSMGKDTA